MGKIIILDEDTANKIAAGEVVERPASVVKELVENAIDAEAATITIEVRNGGISFIRVTDNGTGIEEDDIEIAFERHATSKITNSENLRAISTLGFRGEALASIASVARVEIRSKTRDKSYGSSLAINGGVSEGVKPIGCPDGTTITVRDLFFNTPARYKFLKKDSTEARYITDIVSRIALGNPHISFRLINNGATVLHTPGNNDLLSTIFSIYGKETAGTVRKVQYEDNIFRIYGYIGDSSTGRSTRIHQTFFVNKRYIRSSVISSALDNAYESFIVKGKYPFAVLNIDTNPEVFDVNVHPSKLEIRFSDEQLLYRVIYSAVRNVLENGRDVLDNILEISKNIPLKNYRDSKGTISTAVKNHARPDSSGTDYPGEGNVGESGAGESYVQSRITDYINETREQKQEEGTEIAEEARILDNLEYIGQIFTTYLIFEKGNDIYLIDQHAAHERIKYEETLEAFSKGEKLSQPLAGPVVVELTSEEQEYITENRDFIIQLGFEFETFGNNSVMLRAVPYYDREISIRDEFLKLLDYLVTASQKNEQDLLKEVIYRIACTNAVKANKKLNAIEAAALIQSLGKTKNPLTCHHGRPTIINISRYELEKRFRRKI